MSSNRDILIKKINLATLDKNLKLGAEMERNLDMHFDYLANLVWSAKALKNITVLPSSTMSVGNSNSQSDEPRGAYFCPDIIHNKRRYDNVIIDRHRIEIIQAEDLPDEISALF